MKAVLSSQKPFTKTKTNKNSTQNRKEKKNHKTNPTHVKMPYTCKILEGNEALGQMPYVGEENTSLFCPQIVLFPVGRGSSSFF